MCLRLGTEVQALLRSLNGRRSRTGGRRAEGQGSGLCHTNREPTQLDTDDRRPLGSGVTARQAARPRGGHMAETMLVGVDVGGTFTELVLVDEAGATSVVLTAADPPAVDSHATDEVRRRGRQ